MKNVLIVGAGPSGLMAGIYLKEEALKTNKQINVTIIEKNDRVGKKILSTGNGKCNYSNINVNPKYFNNSNFVGPILESFSSFSLQEWFFNKGLISKVDSEGRVYPITENASSVLDVLRMLIKKYNIKVVNSFNVKNIKRVNNQYSASDGKESLKGDIIILSTGGEAAPVLGSTGEGFKILSEHGIKITKRYPGLVGLKTLKEDVKGLSGLRIKGLVKVFKQSDLIYEESGEIQFKDDGISGIVIMNIASKIARYKDYKLVVDFLPTLSKENLRNYFSLKQKEFGGFDLSNLLIGLVPNILGIKILKDADLNTSINIDNLKEKDIDKIITLLKDYQINYTNSYGFDRAQVTVGGVDLSEVNESLELLKLPNVYLCGEILDIDGMCGGHNLHFAFASGAFVAKQILSK